MVIIFVETNWPGTVKPETLTSGNFDEFGESGSNRQTEPFKVKPPSKISAFK